MGGVEAHVPWHILLTYWQLVVDSGRKESIVSSCLPTHETTRLWWCFSWDFCCWDKTTQPKVTSMCMALGQCICVSCARLVLLEIRRGNDPRNWSYRWLLSAKRVLEIECGPFGRTALPSESFLHSQLHMEAKRGSLFTYIFCPRKQQQGRASCLIKVSRSLFECVLSSI